MKMQKVEIELPVFDGYEFVGYRKPNFGCSHSTVQRLTKQYRQVI